MPLPRYSTVAGIPITDSSPPIGSQALVDRTANGGAEIVALLKTGRRSMRPRHPPSRWSTRSCATAGASLPCATYLQGEYGVDGLFVGVPVVLGPAACSA